jgi:putative oxidoreductase
VPELRDLVLIPAARPHAIDLLYKWFPRVALAMVYLLIGKSKFDPHGMYVRIFDRIGFGDWFRYLTGTLQITGSILVLIPQTFLAGILILACTMAGAVLAWIFFLGSPGTAVIPGVLCCVILVIGWTGRGK